MTFGARARIRLGALRDNYEVIRKAAPDARVMAVIKANAYGHGLLRVAQTLADADAFAVARISEAMQLRAAGIEQPVVLLSGVYDATELRVAAKQNFEIVVHCKEQVEMLESTSGATVTVWVKCDTGMNRLGFPPAAAASVLERLRRVFAVDELRLMTHFASADELDNPATEAQLDKFRPVIDGFAGAVSLANSPAILGWPDIAQAEQIYRFDGDHWVRPGIALFGVSPFAERSAADLGLKPVMQFEARLSAVKPLEEGALVGYKGRYKSQRDTMLGVISAGYGDGYSRHFRSGTPVLINGRRVPLIGNISMDLLSVDLGPGTKDRVGDMATLWGPELPIEEVAPYADAIPYELVCGVTHREPAEYTD